MKASYYQKHYRTGLSSKRLFVLAGLVFTMAIGVSVSATYAWYAISEQFRLGGFDMEINHDEKLKLGRKVGDEIVYKGEQDVFTLQEFGYQKPTLDNISNMSVVNYPDHYDESFLPSFSSGYSGNVAGLTKQAEKGFVQMELYCLCSQDAFLYLTPDTQGIADHEANLDAARQKGVDVDVLDNVLNAARISFYSPLGYRIVELGEHEEVSYCGLLDLDEDGYYSLDAQKKEFLFGVYNGTPSYSSTPLASDQGESKDIFHAKHASGSYVLDESSITPIKEEAKPIVQHVYENGYSNASPIAAIKGNVPTRLVVSVFLEGWDHDMTSALINSSFGLNLGFIALFSDEARDFFTH